MPSKTTVVIIAYNSGHLLKNLIDQLDQYPIILIDNNSTDETEEQQPYSENVTYIRNSKNLGYGRAVNQASSMIDTPFFMLVNPDLNINNEAIKSLENKVADENRSWLFVAPNTGEIPVFIDKKNNEIGWASGCALLINRKQFEFFGGFDENIFLFFEETDLCLRAKKKNILMLYAEDISTPHAIGQSVKASNDLNLIKTWHYHWSRLYFHKKHRHWFSLFNHIIKGLLVYPIKLWVGRRGGSEKYYVYKTRMSATRYYVRGKGAFENGIARFVN